MKITSLQIQKFPEKWMTTVWFDKADDISFSGVGVCKEDSIVALKINLEDYKEYVNNRVAEALGELT